jgi:TRAP-type C4-dicarboxylate transport system substrate-binding protein
MKRRGTLKVFTSIGIISLVLLVAMVASMAGCSKTAETVTTTETEVETSTETEVETSTETEVETATETVVPVTLVFTSHDPKEGSWAETYQPFFDAVEERTNGGIIIEDHWSAELVGFVESYDACVDGVVDMAHIMPTLWPNYFPLEDIANLTKFDVNCLARSQQHTELHSLFPEMDEAYIDSGSKLLFLTGTFPNYSCMTEGNEIRSFADLAGKKYLTTGVWDSEYWTALGMTPVGLMPEESYSALQTGVVDGCTLTLPSLFDFGWGEVANKICMTNVRPAIWACVMNLDTWNSLPAEYQQIFMEESAKIPAIQDEIQLRLDKELRQTAIEQFGAEFITVPAEELAKFNEATESVREAFADQLDAAGYRGHELLEAALMLEQKYAGEEYALQE